MRRRTPERPAAPAGLDWPAVAAAATGAVGISFSAVLVRFAAVAPVTSAFFRVAYALPVLALLWWVTRRRDTRTVRDRWVAIVAGFALSADLIAFHASIGYIGAGLATLLANAQVVIVTLLAWLVLREYPGRAPLAVLPLVMIGMAMITGLGQEGSYGEAPVLGVVLGLTAATFYSLFLLGYRNSNRALSPTSGPLLDATFGAALGTFAAGWIVSPRIDLTISWPAHGWLLILSVVVQVAAWLSIGYALPRLPARITSFVILMQPILAMTWGAILLDERPSALQLGGAALVLSGIAVVLVRSARRSGRLPEPGDSLRDGEGALHR